MSPPKPRKELDSKRLQSSLRANILTTVSILLSINSSHHNKYFEVYRQRNDY